MSLLIYGAGDTGQALLHYVWRHASVCVMDTNVDIMDRLGRQYDVVTNSNGLSDVAFFAQVWNSPPPHLLIAVTSVDAKNLLAGYLCQSINPAVKVLARVDDVSYYDCDVSGPTFASRSPFLNLFSPYGIVSRALIRYSQLPFHWDGLQCQFSPQHSLALKGVHVDESMGWNGKMVQDLAINNGVFVLRIGCGGEAWVAQPSDIISNDHFLYVLMAETLLDTTNRPQHLVVYSNGGIVPWLLQELSALETAITFISSDTSALDHAAARYPGIRVIQGDGTDTSILRQEITAQSVVISATTDVNKNIVCSNMAMGCGSVHAVTWVHQAMSSDPFVIQGAGTLVHTGPHVVNHILRHMPMTQRLYTYPLQGGLGGALIGVTLQKNDPMVGSEVSHWDSLQCRIVAVHDGQGWNHPSGDLHEGSTIVTSLSHDGFHILQSGLSLGL